MSQYTLQIDLLGGEKVEAILQKLSGLTGALGSGGSVFGGSSGGTSPISKQADDVARLTRQVQAGAVGVHALGAELKNLGQGGGVSSKMLELLKALKPGSTAFKSAWEKATQSERDAYNGVGSGGGGKPGRMRINLEDLKKKAQDKSDKDMVSFKKDMSFLMMPLFNAGSMWATLFSGRQSYSAMNTATGKAFRDSKMGGMGAGAATGLLVAGATAAGLVLKALTKTVQETVAAYEHARQIYAKALTGGMGLQFTVKRGMLASIMGVSEQDVFRFGAQMAYLNPKLEWAAAILAKTATPLTQVSWNFKILEKDVSAMSAAIAKDFSPVANDFINWIDKIIKKLTPPVFEETKWDKFRNKNPDFFTVGHLAETARLVGKVREDTGGKGNLFDYLNNSKSSDKAKLFRDAKTDPGDALKILDLAKKWKNFSGDMPSPQAWMKQLPASHLERMGLITMGGGQNYAKDTAKNTKESLAYLKIIASGFRGKGAGGSWDDSGFRGKGAGGDWGMSSTTAQP
jgi:hypothetical protein